jgi:hypothetical protein
MTPKPNLVKSWRLLFELSRDSVPASDATLHAISTTPFPAGVRHGGDLCA